MGELDHRTKELDELDDSEFGVRGAVDAGVTATPRFFYHTASSYSLHDTATVPFLTIPTVDLSIARPRAVEVASAAARDWGIFQVTNHGIPLPAISAALSAVQTFNELPSTETNSAHYTRHRTSSVTFNSNFNPCSTNVACWRNTLRVFMGPTSSDAANIPDVCRRELLAWDEHALGLARRVAALLSEGLGVEAGRLEGLSCLECRAMACHNYPYCPQPKLTQGLAGHTDTVVLTVLVQNEVEGLLMKKGGAVDGGCCSGDGRGWFKVDPVPGAIVVNVGDMLQMISNDEYKSVEHKVVANSNKRPRVSIAIFYSPIQGDESTRFGPLQELVSREKPARYREFTMSEYAATFFNTKLAARSLLSHFKL